MLAKLDLYWLHFIYCYRSVYIVFSIHLELYPQIQSELPISKCKSFVLNSDSIT